MPGQDSLEVDLYRRMILIRLFEEKVLEGFSQGLIAGTTHTCIGQESNAVGVLSLIQKGDLVVGNHRSHGHFLAYCDDVDGLFAEMMGRATGICGGWGGSQHLHREGFFSNGVLGSTASCATGLAFAQKLRATDAVVVCFLGDGALGEGVVYESLNIASLWKLPLLYVIENNEIAQTTPRYQNMAGDIALRFKAFNLYTESVESTDVREIRRIADPLIATCRRGEGASALIIRTVRLASHSKGDDTRSYEELESLKMYDPLRVFDTILPLSVREQLRVECEQRIEEAYQCARNAPLATLLEIR